MNLHCIEKKNKQTNKHQQTDKQLIGLLSANHSEIILSVIKQFWISFFSSNSLFSIMKFCLTGFFIALCFTTTKKVRGLIKKRWNGAREANIRVPRDQCTGHTQAETAAGFNMLDMKNV